MPRLSSEPLSELGWNRREITTSLNLVNDFLMSFAATLHLYFKRYYIFEDLFKNENVSRDLPFPIKSIKIE